MKKVTVICDVPHVITEGVCALCERDKAIRELQAWQQAELELHPSIWHSITQRVEQILREQEA